jgi:hypothetical protein
MLAALLLQFVPFGSFLLHHVDKKYGVEEATDAISMLIAHDVTRNSSSLQTHMVIYNKGGDTWKDWVTNLLHQPDWKDRSIKIADVMKAVLQTKTFGHTAQASFGEEKVHFLSRGRGGGL